MEESGGGSAAGAIVGLLMLVVELAIFAVIIAGMWKLFVKAGQPGWAAIVPIYNTYVMTQIVGRPILWFILTFVPCVNFVAMILIMIDLAKSFGKSTGYAIGMVFLPFIFIPMLGFGDAQYSGPSFKG
ncbi:MAG: signal peptidase I [Archangiaceae bacterium]|nr:signal peptidase I [Archangiaceae bacterium]